ncbi:unnamed protein product [Adineta steineri]|uniref:Strawberry notch-like protein n=1 Tax=Adineta steineri TaxID=433720 RepID=A0A813NJW4_9BILA|nr:unnamed protein product [Adineta steineri]CAF1093531.1 unnamed protein product [Adineta steineri]
MDLQADDLIVNDETNENDDEEEEDDPFSMAVKELSETNRQADEIARQRSVDLPPPTTPIPPKPQSFPNLIIRPPTPITITRPIILHGLHAPVQSPPIIRLQRPITIPSGLYTVPSTLSQLTQQQPSSSTTLVHQFIPALRPTLPPPTEFPTKIPADLETEEDEEEEQQSAQAADTYSDYMPLKLRLGDRHPDPVVETSSLASVELPDITYQLTIPNENIQLNALSALQLETIVYASQRHNTFLSDGTRSGFLIGSDGAGVGKGRTIAGLIYENYLLGRRKSLWLSVSNDLKYDAQRDLCDIGAKFIDVHPLNKLKYAKISSPQNGGIKRGVIFATYSSLISESQNALTKAKYNSRMKQLVQWLGGDEFDGVIVFDECHKAKNLAPSPTAKSSKTGLAVLDLQARLPNARIIYASATGASEPRNMAYMTRLGLWGPGTSFTDFNHFIQAIEQRGVGAMELVAMDMKLRGMYIARQLSFSGVHFSILDVSLTNDYLQTYDRSVQLWIDIKEKILQAFDLADTSNNVRNHVIARYWLSHQRYFKYLCIACKVSKVVDLSRQAVRDGKCVVIGLQSTGEAKTLEQLDELGELNDFVSTAKGVIQSFVEKHFPTGIEQPKTMSIIDLMPKNDEDKNRQNKKRKSTHRRTTTRSISCDTNESSDDSDVECYSSFVPTSKRRATTKHRDQNNNNQLDEIHNSDNENSCESVLIEEDYSQQQHTFAEILGQTDIDGGLPVKRIQKKEVPSNVQNYDKRKMSTSEIIEVLFNMKTDLLTNIELLGRSLPPNTLDELINQLGGPAQVAEMTGRKGRVVQHADGQIGYESRSESDVPLEMLNISERERFMCGEKLVAIISEAASSGISLQADRRCQNTRRRVHVTLELPWSADRAVQQFGRTHRSNQVSAPEYVFVISELAGEKRFASTVAKRLECLGALTHGDRRAAETRDLSRFNIDNKYGRQALENVIRSICNLERPWAPFPKLINNEMKFDFVTEARKALINVGLISRITSGQQVIYIAEKDHNSMSRFLNRILGIRVQMQNLLFRFFSDVLNAVIVDARRSGSWDLGILDLGTGEETVSVEKTQVFLLKTVQTNTTSLQVELHQIVVERGLAFSKAVQLKEQSVHFDDGFYVSNEGRTLCRLPVLALSTTSNVNVGNMRKSELLFRIYRPNTGLQQRHETLESLRKKYDKISPIQVQAYWEDLYHKAASLCIHSIRQGHCPISSSNRQQTCEVGLRSRRFFVLSGSVLALWSQMERILPEGKIQMIRIKTTPINNQLIPLKIVGCIIPKRCLPDLVHLLEKSSVNNFSKSA